MNCSISYSSIPILSHLSAITSAYSTVAGGDNGFADPTTTDYGAEVVGPLDADAYMPTDLSVLERGPRNLIIGTRPNRLD